MAGKLSAFFGAQDMTQGSPMGNLVKFSVPLLIGNMAQQLYSTVDSIVVGNYVGDGALAAVGASNPILNLLLVLFMGISMGATGHGLPVFWGKGPGKAGRHSGHHHHRHLPGLGVHYDRRPPWSAVPL